MNSLSERMKSFIILREFPILFWHATFAVLALIITARYDEIMFEFKCGWSEIFLAESLFSFLYSIFLLIWGILVFVLSPLHILIFSLLLDSFLSLLIITANDVFVFILIRGLFGIPAASNYPADSRIITEKFKAGERTRGFILLGYADAIGLGGIFLFGVITRHILSWRKLFVINFILSVISLIVCILFALKEKTIHIKKGKRILHLKNSITFISFIYGFLFSASFSIFSRVFMYYISSVTKISLKISGIIQILVGVGTVIGYPICKKLDYFLFQGRRNIYKKYAIISAVLSGIFFSTSVVLIAIPDFLIYSLLLAFLAYGTSSPLLSVFFSYTSQEHPIEFISATEKLGESIATSVSLAIASVLINMIGMKLTLLSFFASLFLIAVIWIFI